MGLKEIYFTELHGEQIVETLSIALHKWGAGAY